VTGGSATVVLSKLAAEMRKPDLLISDYRLADGKTGIEAITRLRASLGSAIPAFLVSGDTAPERLRQARAEGYLLLHKPVSPMTLRTTLNRLVRFRGAFEHCSGVAPTDN
jgi:CheY-like chemotaxis protein